MDRQSALLPSEAAQVRNGVARGEPLSPVMRYGVAVIASLVALLVKLGLGPVILPTLYVPAYGAVLVSAWVGGVGPGILAAVLSFGFAQLLFVPPPAAATAAAELARDALFLMVAMALSWGTAALHASQRRMAEVLQVARDELEARVALRTAELREANRRLTDEVARRSEAEEHFRNAFEHAPIGMALVSADGRPLQINTALCRMLGYTHDELLPKPITEVMHPDDLASANADRARLLGGEVDSYRAERRYLHKSGTIVWVEMGVSLVRDRNGRPLNLVSHLHDITERKLAEQALQESEGKFRTLAETVPVATVIFQGESVRYVNPATTALTGYTREELLARRFWDTVHPEHRELVRQRGLARQRGELLPTYHETRILTKSGETRWVDFSAGMIDFEGGLAVLGTAFDVTERKRAEEALRHSEQLLKEQAQWLQSILNSLGEAVVVADAKGKLLYFNPVAERLHGRPLADVAPEDWSREYGVCFPDGTLMPPDEIPLARARHGVATTSNQELAVRPYGQHTLVPVSVTATPLLSEDGSLLGGVVVYRDITERKRAESMLEARVAERTTELREEIRQRQDIEAALRESEQRFRATFEQAAVGVATVGADGRWLMVNDRLCQILGYSREELLRLAVRDVTYPEDLEQSLALMENLLDGQTHRYALEKRYVRGDGSLIWGSVTAGVVRDAGGAFKYGIAVIEDISARKRAEADRRAAEDRLRQLVEQLPAITYVLALDDAQSTMYISPQVEATLGFAPSAWIGDPDLWNRQLHPEDRDRVIAEVAHSHQTATPFSSDYRMYTRDGALVWFHDEAVVIRDDSGQVPFSQGVMIDITARKHAEEELEATNRRIASILEDITGGFFAVDQDWRFTYVNPTAARLVERSAADLVGKNLWEEVPELVGTVFYEQYHRAMTEHVTVEVEAYYPPFNRWYRGRGYPGRTGISVLFEDITEAHEKEVTTLSDILRALNAELNVAAAFPRVAAGLRALTQCDRSTLTFFDPDYDGATVIALSGPRPDVGPGARLLMRDIPAAPTVVAGRPHIVPDLAAELQSPIVQKIHADGFRSVVCLPLRGSEKVLGMLTLTWRKLDGGNAGQLPLLNQIADAVALATEKSRLFEEVRAGHERLEALSHRLLEVQEAERQHIARELHDEIGQALTALKLSLARMSGAAADGNAGRLSDTRRQVNELLARVRNLALDLRPAMLDDLGLLPALLWLFERYAAQTRVQVSFEHRGLARRFIPEVETAAYRIVQEALTNVARHAHVRQVTVRAWIDPGTLCVQIIDQGSGFDAEAPVNAGVTSGVTGMRERAGLLGGHLTVESAPGKGTRVSAELPLDETRNEVTPCP